MGNLLLVQQAMVIVPNFVGFVPFLNSHDVSDL